VSFARRLPSHPEFANASVGFLTPLTALTMLRVFDLPGAMSCAVTLHWLVDVPELLRFRDSSQFGSTIDAGAERLGISATAVEKDYWVSEVLRVLAAEFGQDFVFKGGTSLSKGYRLVRRFSEDIDLLLLPNGRGRAAIDTAMRRMADRAAEWVGGNASPSGSADRDRHRAYEVHYPASRPATAVIRTSVLLEMGVRGGSQPSELTPIGSLLGDALTGAGVDISGYRDLAPFEVLVLHPGRTLLEKLTLVHVETQRLMGSPELVPNPWLGRHFYDIHELLGDERVRALLSRRDDVGQILEEIKQTTRKYFLRGEDQETVDLYPSGGFSQCPAFTVDSHVSQRFRSSYEATMPELLFGPDPLPQWGAICKRVADSRELL
jgi:hypothetical protein